MKKPGEEIEKRVRRTLAENGTQSVLACVSGGADSVALLLALLAAEADVTVLHCNFHLRGEESMRDQESVERLCSRLDVPLEVRDFDVREWMEVHHSTSSVEEACRDMRYEWFRQRSAETGALIATGHNADDNVETLLLNLFRGSGLKGLKCMSPFNGEILRPLITSTRNEILAYLGHKGEDFVTDSSNLTSDFRRNFLRNELIPLAETRWPGLKRGIGRTIENLRSEYAMLDRLMNGARFATRILPLSELLADREGALATLFHFIAPHGGSRTVAEEAVRTAFAEPYRSGATWSLGGRKRLTACRRDFRITDIEAENVNDPMEIFICEEVEVTPESLAEMRASCGNRTLYLPEPMERYIFRHPVTGDRIRPIGMRGSRLLSDVMKDAGIPLPDRQSVWVAVERTDAGEEGEVIWAEGLRRSRLHLVDAGARRFYRIRRRGTQLP